LAAYSCSGPGGTQQGKVVFTSGKEEKRKSKGQGLSAGTGHSVQDGKATVKPVVTSGQAATVKHASPDVYTKDEHLIPAGPYYNVRAGRGMVMEEEIVMGVTSQVKRTECGFDLEETRG
jgi:ribosomal protein L13E